MLPQRIRETAEPGDGGGRRCEQDERAGQSNEDLQRRADHVGDVLTNLRDDSDERRADPIAAEQSAVLRRKRGEADDGDRDVEDDDQADGAEETPR